MEQYISIVKKYDLGNQYLRGENQKYSSISSSLVRGYVPKNKRLGLEYIYSCLLEAYYQEVGYKLDKMQEDNFLAFSQHHGLKTNLIDFTTAPLVALYFACERDKYDVDSGFVYVLNKDDTVNASEFLCKYSIKEHFCYNIFRRLYDNDMKFVDEFRLLLEKVTSLLSRNNSYALLEYIIKQIRNYPQLKDSNSYLKERDKIDMESIGKAFKIPNLIKKYISNFNILGSIEIMEFTAILVIFFRDIKNYGAIKELPKDISFPKMPYFMYKTPLKFDRINNQSGVFLYQGFMDYQTHPDELGGLMVQKIIPNMVIQIYNQEEIMKELDMVGINKRYIYGDFDNTAKYINTKFFGN